MSDRARIVPLSEVGPPVPARQRGLGFAKLAAAAFGAWLLAALARGGVAWTPAFFLCSAALGWLFAEGPRPWERRPAVFVFFVCAACYLSTFRWHGADDLPTSLVPFALLRHGTLALDAWIDPFLTGKTNDFTLPATGGRFISIYPVASALLALPVYVIPAVSGVQLTDQFLHNLSKLSATLITAASAAALYAAMAPRASGRWALCLAFFYGLGSWAFSLSSQALWQHGPASLGIALGCLGLSRSGGKADLLAGFGFGLAVAARPDSIFMAAAFGLYVLFHRTWRVPLFTAGAAIPAAALVFYWVWYTGRPLPPESGFQQKFFMGIQPNALAALLVSPTRGVLFFSPFLALGVWAAFRPQASAIARWAVAGAAASWVFFACYSPWVAGTTFGSRYFAGIAAALSFVCAELEGPLKDRPRALRLFCFAGAFSVLIHALGAYLNWPGTDWIATAKMQAWWWSYHPWVYLMTDEGGLKALPWILRTAIALAGLAGVYCAGDRIHRKLAS